MNEISDTMTALQTKQRAPYSFLVVLEKNERDTGKDWEKKIIGQDCLKNIPV